jgi:N-acetylneuraminic acid mutarotase
MKIILLLFLFVAQFTLAQQWQPLTSIPSDGRDDGVAFSLNGCGFVVTGNQGSFAESNRLWSYNPTNNSWSEKSAFPGEKRQYAGVFTIGMKAYVFCGISPTSVPLKDVWEYDGVKDQWIQLNDFPGVARWSPFNFSDNENGYLGAGAVTDSTVSDCWKYSPKVDSWSQIADYPEGPIRDVVGLYVGGTFFAGTGFKINPLTFSRSFYSYFPGTNSWTKIDNFPGEARGYAIGQGDGLTGVVGGGWGSSNTFYKDSYFLSHKGEWSNEQVDFPTGVRGMSAFSLTYGVCFTAGLKADFTRSSDLYCLWFAPEISPHLYPNPTDNESYILFHPNSEISVFNLEGKLLEMGKADSKGKYILANRPSGIYMVKAHPIDSYEKLHYTLRWIVR